MAGRVSRVVATPAAAVIAIDDVSVLVGVLPSTALDLVRGWANMHRGELNADWDRIVSGRPPEPITPLP